MPIRGYCEKRMKQTALGGKGHAPIPFAPHSVVPSVPQLTDAAVSQASSILDG